MQRYRKPTLICDQLSATRSTARHWRSSRCTFLLTHRVADCGGAGKAACRTVRTIRPSANLSPGHDSKPVLRRVYNGRHQERPRDQMPLRLTLKTGGELMKPLFPFSTGLAATDSSLPHADGRVVAPDARAC